MINQQRAAELPTDPEPKLDTLTIGGMIASGHRLFADCVYCNRHEELDLRKLEGILGSEHSALRDSLLPRLVCKECGSRDRLQFIVMPVCAVL